MNQKKGCSLFKCTRKCGLIEKRHSTRRKKAFKKWRVFSKVFKLVIVPNTEIIY